MKKNDAYLAGDGYGLAVLDYLRGQQGRDRGMGEGWVKTADIIHGAEAPGRPYQISEHIVRRRLEALQALGLVDKLSKPKTGNVAHNWWRKVADHEFAA